MQQTDPAQPVFGHEVIEVGGFAKPPRKPQNYIEQLYADAVEVSDQLVAETMEHVKMLGKAPIVRRVTSEGYEEFVVPKELGPRERYEYYRTVFEDDRATLAWIQSHSVRWAIEAMQDYQKLRERYG